MKRINGNRNRLGFTLIEIMVVVIVLAILAAVVVPNLAGRTDEARVARARSDIADLTTLLEGFRLDMRRYPYEEEGLAILREPPNTEDADFWKGPYSRRPIPLDPWGRPYMFVAPAPNGIDEYGVQSLGRDGEVGGVGYDKDISSWTNYEEEEF